ncbi:MAG: metallophosphoesterase [Thermoanaerobaculia bacterium]|nr:metallophosphoesterase [Thermoanaerobaculia bacterium]
MSRTGEGLPSARAGEARQILHVSDIHFGPHFLSDVADGVTDLVDRKRPDLVVVSGDLTQRAKIVQFRDARRWVDALQAPWIAVPGNHDIPMYRVWERLFVPYGAYKKNFSDEMEPLFECAGLFVVGINTAYPWTIKDGRFTIESLRRVKERLESAPADAAKIVVAHHPTIPPPRFDSRRVARRSLEALHLFAHMEVEMVLSGHVHQTWIGTSEEFYPQGHRPVLLVNSGTSTSARGRGWEKKRNSANWIRIDHDAVTISHLLWHPVERGFLEWSRHHYPRRHIRPFDLGLALDDPVV